MDDLRKALSWFHFRVMLRMSAYAALWGLLLAIVVVIAAPWLRQTLGAPNYEITLALPLALPALYVAWIWLRRPDPRTVVQAADAWSGNTGAVVAAYELGNEHPDSPFVKPTVERAAKLVRDARLPEPRPLRWALTALLVMIGLVPLSRWAHAQMQENEQAEKEEEAAKKTDVPPTEAEKLAKEAGNAAEKAKQTGASQQEKLADDIEQAARNAQAGGQDKERALREAHSLVDRAKSQREQQQARDDARESLKKNEEMRDLANATENADARAMMEEARKLAEDLHRPDGSLDPEKAAKVREAVAEARRNAPNDANLRRAAEAIEKSLNEATQRNAKQAREQMEKALAEQGKTTEEVNEALKRLGELDKQALANQLEELAKQLSPLRDLDPSGKQMEELLKQLKDAKISPEQARQLAEQAAELSKRLELDAETLRKMLQEGKKFEGLEEMAKEMVEQAKREGTQIDPGEVPEWVKEAMPKEWKEGQGGKEGQPNGQGGKEGQPNGQGGKEGQPNGQGGKEGQSNGQGGKEGQPNGQGGKEAGNEGGKEGGEGTEGGGHKPNGGEGTKPIEGEGNKEGVDTKDTGQGEKNPDGKEERLDPNKAKDETAIRGTTGNEGTSKGVNTKEEEERLPRRYRDTARKYFER